VGPPASARRVSGDEQAPIAVGTPHIAVGTPHDEDGSEKHVIAVTANIAEQNGGTPDCGYEVDGGRMTAELIEEIRPSMTGPEFECLTRHLRRARTYVEFGAGGSTVHAARLKVPTVVSVESDPNWAAKLQAQPDIKRAEEYGRLKIHYVDVGPVMAPGYPTDAASARKWSNYYTSLWSLIDARKTDVFLIDGRFRVACILAVLRRCNLETPILVHDWERVEYHAPVLRFAHCESVVDRLALLRRRENFDWFSMCETALTYALDPS
jgi:hypothetical protein